MKKLGMLLFSLVCLTLSAASLGVSDITIPFDTAPSAWPFGTDTMNATTMAYTPETAVVTSSTTPRTTLFSPTTMPYIDPEYIKLIHTEPTRTTPTTTAPGETRPQQTTEPTTTTTTTLFCGNDPAVCYVEFDITGDRVPECCDAGNNPACEQCIDSCKEICDQTDSAVKFCFGTNISLSCDCTEGTKPTCYQTTSTTTSTTTTTYATAAEAAIANRPLFYLIFLVGLVGVLAALVYYVRNI